MAASSTMVCMLVLTLATVSGAAAQRTGNMAFLSPVTGLPHLAKPEPTDFDLGTSGRLLLGKANPAKSAWKFKGSSKRQTAEVFKQGVSSGDPFAKSVILWTRLTVPQQNKQAFLDYCVSKDRKFSKCVTRGTTLTNKDVDFTSKVEARGLKPNTMYFYQWRYRKNDKAAPVYSQVGRTRTLPRADEDIARTRIAFFGCSQLPLGFFTAYGQIARAAWNGEIDYNIHTGDYIYETERNASEFILPQYREQRTHFPKKEILTVADYRARHNQYNSDPDTAAMRGSAPFIPVWDDHEYTNDANKDGAQNHQPETEGDWGERKLRALQVYYEQMPIRQANADNKQQIYRNFEIGKLIKLIMLDTRIIGRSPQNASLAAVNDPNRTILGAAQRTYLKDQLSAAEGKQTWKVLGQQVLFIHRCDILREDKWDGYRRDQLEIYDHLQNNKIQNTIVLTGDIHQHWANDVPRNPCPNEPGYSYNPATGAGSLAVEFVSSAVSSTYNPTEANRNVSLATTAALRAANPHTKYNEVFLKGWAILDVKRKHATCRWYLTPDLTRPGQYNTMTQGEAWRTYTNQNHLVPVDFNDGL
jgi:alkaline phosphatase D